MGKTVGQVCKTDADGDSIRFGQIGDAFIARQRPGSMRRKDVTLHA